MSPTPLPNSPSQDLAKIYQARFEGQAEYRRGVWVIRIYLALPFLWRFFGKQFLVVLKKPS